MTSPLKTGGFLTIWRQTSIRHWRQHPLQSVTLVAILALGVASFLSIRMANRAAVRGFSGFTDTITGKSDFTLEASGDRFLIEWLPELRKATSDHAIEFAPMLEISARFLQSPDSDLKETPNGLFPGKALRIVGVDLVGIQNINNYKSTEELLNTAVAGERLDLFQIIRDPSSVFLSPRFTETINLKVGDSFFVLIGDRQESFTLRGILPTNRSGVDVPENLMLMDLPAVMALTGKKDAVSRVEVILESEIQTDEELDVVFNKLIQASQNRWSVIRGDESNQTGAEMTAAFRLNLTILSLISLLVGLYLITQSMDAAVIQRRREIGILRALGLQPNEIRSLWMFDLAAFGITGSLLGILLGWLAAQTVVVAIARTVNALYMTTTAESARLTAGDWVLGLLLGTLGSFIAGSFPLRIATRTDPAKILASGRQELSQHAFGYRWLAIALLVAGTALSLGPPIAFNHGRPFPLLGYFTAFSWLLGGAISAAAVIALIGRVLHRIFSSWTVPNLGFGKLRLPGSRHRLAVSGLFVAIGMAASMSILIGSFETTVVTWLKTRFQADVYLSSRAFTGATSQHFIRTSTIDQIGLDDRVDAISTYRYLSISYQKSPIYLIGFRSDLLDVKEKFVWIEKPLPLEQQPAGTDAWVIINETFQYRFSHAVGDVITIRSPTGEQRLWIRGLKADYGNDRGGVMVDRLFLNSWYEINNYSSATLYLKKGGDTQKVIENLRKTYPELSIREQETLLNDALQIFEETFSVTYALKVLGLFVAVIGLALALLNILREDSYSLTTLRALGLRRRELAGVTACEGFGLTLVAALSGLILSFVLGWLLVYVINRQSFGWTLQYHIPWIDLFFQTILLLILGAMVSWLVGWFGAEQKPQQEE